MQPAPRMSRRSFLQTATGATVVAAAASTASAQEGQQQTVEMTDGLVFDPDTITIAPGDTVVWENVGTIGHSVTAYEDGIPGDAAYFASGGFDAEQPARNAYQAGDPESGDVAGGETFEHTFEVEGTYEYFCIPHESAGMLGAIEVTPGGAPADGNGGGDGGDGEFLPEVPDVARTTVIVATVFVLVVVGLTYFFLKYGGEYGPTDGD